MKFNTVELGVPWYSVEATPGQYDFSEVDKRVEYARSKGLGIRFRINVQGYGEPFPSWFHPEFQLKPDGSIADNVPSLFSKANFRAQSSYINAVARRYAGHGYQYTLGIGEVFELKYGGWYTYEPSAKATFRRWLADRYGTISQLNAAWQTDYSSFDEIGPPVPASTPTACCQRRARYLCIERVLEVN